MMTLTYQSDSGRTIQIGGDSTYMLTGVDGIHGLTASVHSYTQYQQDGETYVGSQMQSRVISLQLYITGGDIPAKRIELLRAFSPKEQGTLTLRRGYFVRQIRCVVEQAPSFAQTNGYKCGVGLYCPSPYWELAEESRQDIVTWEGALEWPMEFPIEGWEFGRRTEARVINVYNPGDVDVGMRIVFLALGKLSTPALVNASTYQFIRINADMEYGDKFEISTVPGHKFVRSIKADGTTSNALPFLDPYSTLVMMLNKGDNLLRYEAKEEENKLDVKVYFRLQYLGV